MLSKTLKSKRDSYYKDSYFYTEGNNVVCLNLDTFNTNVVFENNNKLYINFQHQNELMLSQVNSSLIFPDGRWIKLSENDYIVIGFDQKYIVIKSITLDQKIEIIVKDRNLKELWRFKTNHHLCIIEDGCLLSWAANPDSSGFIEKRNIVNGELIWTTDLRIEKFSSNHISQVELLNDKIIIKSGSVISILNISNGQILGRYNFSEYDRYYTSPFGISEGKILVFSSNKKLNEISHSSLVAIERDLDGNINKADFGKPFYYNHHIYCIDNYTGSVQKINYQTLKLVGTCKLTNTSRKPSASINFYLWNEKMFVYDFKETIYKIHPEKDFELITA